MVNIAMSLAIRTAKKFSLNKGEEKIFKDAWKWRKKAEKAINLSHDDMNLEVERHFKIFADRISKGKQSKELGHEFVAVRPVKNQKYVVFSDHHYSVKEDRQNLFGQKLNQQLYIEMLERYYNEGYTLVENGDVEELIIFEPTKDGFKERSEMSLDELNIFRRTERAKKYKQMLQDPRNEGLYKVLLKFHKAGRFIKIIGNHDYDLQYDECYELLEEVFPGIERPYDYLLLEDEFNNIKFAILHGHQFDPVTNPTVAKSLGETISESLGWAYQGADRNWSWDQHSVNWAEGKKNFENSLVGAPPPHFSKAITSLGILGGRLKNRDRWESLFGHDIAWEYFDHSNPLKAYKKEIKKGEQWFKFRHLDEYFIKTLIENYFKDPDKRPKIVLGHSHEVRYEPVFKVDKTENYEKFPYYYNSGAAGRFENLIWGLEISNGLPTIVSWHKEGNKKKGGLKRNIYRASSIINGCDLTSSQLLSGK